jgi:hypothetical protein
MQLAKRDRANEGQDPVNVALIIEAGAPLQVVSLGGQPTSQELAYSLVALLHVFAHVKLVLKGMHGG